MTDYRRGTYTPTWLDKREHARAVSLYRDYGLSKAQIAERFGVSQAAVRRVLIAAGVKLDGRHSYAGSGNGAVRVFGGTRTVSCRRS